MDDDVFDPSVSDRPKSQGSVMHACTTETLVIWAYQKQTAQRAHDVKITSIRRQFGTICPLGEHVQDYVLCSPVPLLVIFAVILRYFKAIVSSFIQSK